MVACLVAGCGSAQPAKSVASVPSVRYYVSLGDSYAVGAQPSPAPHPTAGFTAYVATAEHLDWRTSVVVGRPRSRSLSANGCTGLYGPAAAT